MEKLPDRIEETARLVLEQRDARGFRAALRRGGWVLAVVIPLCLIDSPILGMLGLAVALLVEQAMSGERIATEEEAFSSEAARATLGSLLGEACCTDARTLSVGCRRNLIEILRCYSVRSTRDIDPLLAIRIMRVLTLARETRLLLHLGHLAQYPARTEGERQIREAARRCVTLWLHRLDRQSEGALLLRSASANGFLLRQGLADSAAHYLRPAGSAPA